MFKSQLAREAIMNLENVDKTLIGWGATILFGAISYIYQIRDHGKRLVSDGKRLEKLEKKVYPEDDNHRLATAMDLEKITKSIASQGKCIGEIKEMVARLDERNPKKK